MDVLVTGTTLAQFEAPFRIPDEELRIVSTKSRLFVQRKLFETHRAESRNSRGILRLTSSMKAYREHVRLVAPDIE